MKYMIWQGEENNTLGALRGVPAREGGEQRSASQGETSPLKCRKHLLNRTKCALSRKKLKSKTYTLRSA